MLEEITALTEPAFERSSQKDAPDPLSLPYGNPSEKVELAGHITAIHVQEPLSR